MDQARSDGPGRRGSGLDWLETPDQAVVWATALGLGTQIEDVLERSVDDMKDGRATSGGGYLPIWYSRHRRDGLAGERSAEAVAAALLELGAIPNFGGMMAAIGTIGNSPSSSGSGGGFGGGGFGGGGGGGGRRVRSAGL